jgi:formate hydrogenlyase subunit 3/multisubunit Na+/H+ antiporter MnhD subunit
MNFFLVSSIILVGFVFALFGHIGFTFKVDWFLYGLYFRIDFIGKIFLIFSSFVWLMSALYSYKTITINTKRYWFWFLLTFIGNYGLILSYDAIGFYLFFSLMSLAAFGLVIHSQTSESNHAAFVYIKYAVLGEVALFIAILLSAHHYGGFYFALYTSDIDTLSLWFFLVGFGIKAGMLFLHFWLPLAHGNAPAAASAVLSGVMLKAGILGMVRYLPFGYDIELLGGITLCILGVAGIYAGAYGIFQKKLKVVLAYSSISQMGYLITLLGVGLLNPTVWDTILLAVVFFSLHHAINKSALFLLSGEILKNGLQKQYIVLGLVFVLSLIGAVYTSGSLAKGMLLDSISSGSILLPILSFSMIVTAILMVKGYFICRKVSITSSYSSYSLYILYPMAILSLLLFIILS